MGRGVGRRIGAERPAADPPACLTRFWPTCKIRSEGERPPQRQRMRSSSALSRSALPTAGRQRPRRRAPGSPREGARGPSTRSEPAPEQPRAGRAEGGARAYVCVRVCMHACICVRAHTHVHTCIHAHISAHVHAHIRAHMHVNTHAYTSTRHMHACTCAHTCTHTHAL